MVLLLSIKIVDLRVPGTKLISDFDFNNEEICEILIWLDYISETWKSGDLGSPLINIGPDHKIKVFYLVFVAQKYC